MRPCSPGSERERRRERGEAHTHSTDGDTEDGRASCTRRGACCAAVARVCEFGRIWHMSCRTFHGFARNRPDLAERAHIGGRPLQQQPTSSHLWPAAPRFGRHHPACARQAARDVIEHARTRTLPTCVQLQLQAPRIGDSGPTSGVAFGRSAWDLDIRLLFEPAPPEPRPSDLPAARPTARTAIPADRPTTCPAARKFDRPTGRPDRHADLSPIRLFDPPSEHPSLSPNSQGQPHNGRNLARAKVCLGLSLPRRGRPLVPQLCSLRSGAAQVSLVCRSCAARVPAGALRAHCRDVREFGRIRRELHPAKDRGGPKLGQSSAKIDRSWRHNSVEFAWHRMREPNSANFGGSKLGRVGPTLGANIGRNRLRFGQSWAKCG